MQRENYDGAYGPYYQPLAWTQERGPTTSMPKQNGSPEMTYLGSTRAPSQDQSHQSAVQAPSNTFNTHGSFSAKGPSVIDTQLTSRRASAYERPQPSELQSDTDPFPYTSRRAGQQQGSPSLYNVPGPSWGSIGVHGHETDNGRNQPASNEVSSYNVPPTYQTTGATSRGPSNLQKPGLHHGPNTLHRPPSIASQQSRPLGEQRSKSSVSHTQQTRSPAPNISMVTSQSNGVKQTHGHVAQSPASNATVMHNVLRATNEAHYRGMPVYPSARGNNEAKFMNTAGSQIPLSQQSKTLRPSSTFVHGGSDSGQPDLTKDIELHSLDDVRENRPINARNDQHYQGIQHEIQQDEDVARKLVAATNGLQSDYPAQNAPAESPEKAASAGFITSSSQRPDHDMATDAAVKDQMEVDMKQMIERMRQYKSKDPSLFVQIWDQVKKGLPPQMAPSRTTPKPAASPTMPEVSVVSPSPSNSPPKGLTDDENASTFPLGFDRGRFPALRRRRGGLHGGTRMRLMSSAKTATPIPQTSGPSSALQNLSPAPVAPMTATPSIPSRQVTSRLQDDSQDIITLTPPVSAPSLNRHVDGPSSLGQVAFSSTSEIPSGVTHWPEDKKKALAEAASILLTTGKESLSKTIKPHEIMEILDRNPSYSQVCEYFRSQGFEFDEAVLARDLLQRIPNPPSATSNLPTSNPHPRPLNVAQPSSPYASPVDHLPKQPVSSQQTISPAIVNQEPATSESIRAFVSGKAWEPISKELKARKRKFSDLIDLTQIEDQDFNVRHQVKKPHMDQVLVPETKSLLTRPRQPKREHLIRAKLIEPMDKRRDAARRSSYDPKTIVSDVLIVTAKHPTLAPLNAHLNILRSQFDSVDDGSDLSTFRWDLVDPDEASSNEFSTSSITADDNDGKRGHKPSPTPGAEDAMTFVRKSKQTIPSTSPMKAVVINGQRETPKDTSASSPTRIIMRRSPLSKADLLSQPTANQRLMQEASESTSPHPEAKGHRSEPSREVVAPMPKRRGRPPGAKNKSPRPDKGIPKKRKNSIDPDNGTAPLSRTSSTPIKPSNLRNVVTPANSNGLAVLISSRSPSASANEPHDVDGISSDFSKHEPRQSQSVAKAYPTYKCRWHHCPAELHNMPTLRKHIEKHRSRLNFPFSCEWQNCERIEAGKAPPPFRTQDGWEAHLQAHLEQIEADEDNGLSPDHLGSSSKENKSPQAVKSA